MIAIYERGYMYKLEEKIMSHIVSWIKAGLITTIFCAPAVQAQTQSYDLSDIIPRGDNGLGYKVDNHTMRLKVHPVLPQRSSFRNEWSMNEQFTLANLESDEATTYFGANDQPIVLIDRHSGEVKRTQYVGQLRCYKDGNIALFLRETPSKGVDWHGKFGEELTSYNTNVVKNDPNLKSLNLQSCTLHAWNQGIYLKNGTKADKRVFLRNEHGALLVVEGGIRPSNSAQLPEDVKELMQKPFMQGMAVSPATEQWYLHRPDGEEVWIRNNPGEAIGPITYLPYLNAYHLRLAGRAMLPNALNDVPHFGRLLYPDGRVELIQTPDVLDVPSRRHEVGGVPLFTKAGVIWKVHYTRIDQVGRTNYRGDLEEGYYLQKKDTKVLVKLPDLGTTETPSDGCTLALPNEAAQSKPTYLVNRFTVNICTGE